MLVASAPALSTEEFRLSHQRLSLVRPKLASLASATGMLAVVFTALCPASTQDAIANGDTRTISLHHSHTNESISATFRVDGQYDRASLDKLNWFLRDWRTNEPTKMDPKLFDVIWETYRESGSRQPILIVSAYRSPATNSMLRRRSRAVAEHSQHTLGKAMDMHYQDVSMSKVREIAMRLQRGGVGYYPTAGTPFVHLDVGSVRAWPRMSHDQLARLFPDGKTVHLPSNGGPLARYQEARAEIEARGNRTDPIGSGGSGRGFFASLFGRGDEDRAAAPARGGNTRLARATVADEEEGSEIQTPAQRRGVETLARAQRNLPRGETVMGSPAQVAAADTFVAPAPPRRPAELAPPAAVVAAASGPAIPLPPVRPLALAALETAPAKASASAPRQDPFAGLLARAANLPEVITQGIDAPAPDGSGAFAPLAYAPETRTGDPVRPPLAGVVARAATPALAQPIGLRSAHARRKPQMVAARLDRSNFVSITNPHDMSHNMPQTQLGSATGLRAAAQVDENDLVFSLNAPLTTRFGSIATELRTERFSGPAVRPLRQTNLGDDQLGARIGVATLSPR
ncbi:MAG: hypothetical protein JWL93_1481 [Hyphomicrobiales bacterium]|nr:hypothetical protein [Hyphomicrobiales bacterium]